MWWAVSQSRGLPNTTKTILGATQWAWLRQQLLIPATIKSSYSTQLCTAHNGWEAWANYPHEMDKFSEQWNRRGRCFCGERWRTLCWIQQTYTCRTISDYWFHFQWFNTQWSQYICKSFQSRKWGWDWNFGMINIDWNTTPATIKLDVCGFNGDVRASQTISLNDLNSNFWLDIIIKKRLNLKFGPLLFVFCYKIHHAEYEISVIILWCRGPSNFSNGYYY